MHILAISDVVDPLLYDYFDPDNWRGRVDLVISCGDLDKTYLEFLVTELEVPLLYVPGNHDAAYREDPPEGCESIDGRVCEMGGLRIAGIGGSLNYNSGPDKFQYTERQMTWRLRRLGWRAMRTRGIDLVVSHAAPHLNDSALDAKDEAHRGSIAFERYIERHHPRWWLHGHNHLYDCRVPRISKLDQTVVINAFGHYILDTAVPIGGVKALTPRRSTRKIGGERVVSQEVEHHLGVRG